MQRQPDVAASQAIEEEISEEEISEEEISVGDLSYQMTDQHLHDLFSETVQDTARPTDVEVEETRKRVRAGRGYSDAVNAANVPSPSGSNACTSTTASRLSGP